MYACYLLLNPLTAICYSLVATGVGESALDGISGVCSVQPEQQSGKKQ
jgi:hypothetical protein